MASKRTVRSPEQLEQAAKHVTYEIEMLLFAAGYLAGEYGSPLSEPIGNLKNMALESFLTHFRNLRNFLCPNLSTRVYDDDVLASDFLGIERADLGHSATLGADQARLDKMLAHLSYSREGFIEAQNYKWQTSRMQAAILEGLEIFLAKLTPATRAWFPAAERISAEKATAEDSSKTETHGTMVITSSTARLFKAGGE